MDKQKDFEKGWEEHKAKKKQEIKEIAEVICGCASPCTLEDWDECDKMADCVRVKKIAKALHLAGYRKIPENAVVLTREESDELQLGKDFNYGVHCGERNMTLYYENIRLPEARKETVEKFAERLKARYAIFYEETRISIKAIRRDIDEIAKKITEGNSNAENGN